LAFDPIPPHDALVSTRDIDRCCKYNWPATCGLQSTFRPGAVRRWTTWPQVDSPWAALGKTPHGALPARQGLRCVLHSSKLRAPRSANHLETARRPGAAAPFPSAGLTFSIAAVHLASLGDALAERAARAISDRRSAQCSHSFSVHCILRQPNSQNADSDGTSLMIWAFHQSCNFP
jgi:hypothetical protein